VQKRLKTRQTYSEELKMRLKRMCRGWLRSSTANSTHSDIILSLIVIFQMSKEP
jgi:hypothetical protein